MKRLLVVLTAALVLLAGLPALAAELTGAEIMEKVDDNAYFSTSHMRATMTIRSRNREMVKEMEAWGDAESKAGLMTFHNPGDRGTKYLKLGDELWMFFPNADDLVKISGHMLRQGMMGSDFSYSDAIESEKMTELYDFTVVGKEKLDGRTAYVIEANALPGTEVSYAKRKSWIDTERFVALKEELYAASGKLMKVMTTKKIQEIDGRYIATEVVMEDQLKRNSSTTLTITELTVGVDIPAGLLSLRSLMR